MNINEISRIAGLVGEPSRTAMLLELLDGRALTAHELARAAGIQAPAASRHLALLVEAGLLQLERQGRHRYHRLASPEVARMLEGIMQLAVRQAGPRRASVVGPKEAAMRRVRSCYDHLAGRLGVAIAERLQECGAVVFEGEAGRIAAPATRALAALGIGADPDGHTEGGRARRRPFCRPCLDWSERRPHLAGTLGALICAHCIEKRWLVRRSGGRALDVSPPGEMALRAWLGAERWAGVMAEAGSPG